MSVQKQTSQNIAANTNESDEAILGQILKDIYNISTERFKEIIEDPVGVLSAQPGIPQDQRHTEQINNYVKQFYPDSQELSRREQILKEIQEIVNKWCDDIHEDKNITPEEIKSYRAKILSYGSYCLGVSSKDGDMDLVIIAPNSVEREKHFKGQLVDIIKSNPNVTECKYIDSQSLITFYYKKQPIDLSLGVIQKNVVDNNVDEYLLDDEAIGVSDNRSQKSLNGRRNNKFLIKDQTETYKKSLQAIKILFKNLGINQNKLGYFGGIDMAILCFKICKLFPNYPVNKVIHEFFRLYHIIWKYTDLAIKITPNSPDPTLLEQQQKQQPLPMKQIKIYTPCKPVQNTNKAKLINMEMIQRIFLLKSIEIETQYQLGKKDWSHLFQKLDFFDQYQQYIVIDMIVDKKQYENQLQDTEKSKFEESNKQTKNQIIEEVFNNHIDSIEVFLISLYEKMDQELEKGYIFHPFCKAYKFKEKQVNDKLVSSHFIGVKKIKNSQYPDNNEQLQLTNFFCFWRQILVNKNKIQEGEYKKVDVYQMNIQELVEYDLEGFVSEQTIKKYKVQNNNNSLNKKRPAGNDVSSGNGNNQKKVKQDSSQPQNDQQKQKGNNGNQKEAQSEEDDVDEMFG